MLQVIDTKELRSALGTFVSGITVVTTRESDGTLRGFTANSFTSVSLDPPLVLVCLSNTADCYSAFRSAASFAINVLSEEQRHVSSAFASKSDDKFREIEYRLSGSGSPLIVGTCAWFDCVSHDTVDAGDHAILIGRVVEFEHAPASPLGYCRGAYISFSLSQELPMAGNHPVCVGAILERDGRILFTVTDEGKLRLPVGRSIGTESDPTSLFGRLRRLGVEARLEFLFSVFEDPGSSPRSTSIYYRGLVERDLTPRRDLNLVAFYDIPWGMLAVEDEKGMLQRFIRERTEDTFGVFAGVRHLGSFEYLHPAASKHSTETDPRATART